MSNVNNDKSDKRSVHTDALQTLGSVIGTGEKRDAIHIAVDPAVAAEDLYPGDHVGFVNGGLGKTLKTVGIVDPFIIGPIRKGQSFWLLVYPRQITSLRHVWSHPDFSEEESGKPAPTAHEQRLRDFAKEVGVGFGELIEHAREYAVYEEYWHEGERFEGQGIYDEFWADFEAVTGIKPKNDWGFFACSC